MNRHELDAVSLTAGVLFATIAVVTLLGRAELVDVQAKWLWPMVLIGLGLAGLLAALRPDRDAGPGRHEPPVPGTVDATSVVTEPVVTESVASADADGPAPS